MHRYPTSPQQLTKVHKYLLKDYTFLHDYIIVDACPSKSSRSVAGLEGSVGGGPLGAGKDGGGWEVFLAQIIGTEQMVRFNKIGYDSALLGRFQALVQLYDQGIILLDNIFILQQSNQLYFYIIQAHTTPSMTPPPTLTSKPPKPPRYTTLSQLTNSPTYSNYTLNRKSMLIDKLKILLDCVHQTGQPYVGLTSGQVIIDLEDQEGGVYLAPFQVEVVVGGDRGRMGYFGPEMLEVGGGGRGWQDSVVRVDNEKLFKNDIWSFGCIMLQILFFSSPAFYSLNNTNQYKMIQAFMSNDREIVKNTLGLNFQQQFSIKWCVEEIFAQFSALGSAGGQTEINKGQLLGNLLLNTLEMEPGKRILSSQRGNQYNMPLKLSKTKDNNSRQKCRPYSTNSKSTSSKWLKTYKKQQNILSNPNQNIITSLSSPINAIRQPKNPKTFHTRTNFNKSTQQKQPYTHTYTNPQPNTKNNHTYHSVINLQQPPTDKQQDCQFVLQLLQISNLHIHKQLRINIYLDKKHSIFVTPYTAHPDTCPNVHHVNKTIRVRASYPELKRLLTNLFVVQLCEKEAGKARTNCYRIEINLSTLVILEKGVRVWDKPIIGSYSCRGNSYTDQLPVVKIKAELFMGEAMYECKDTKKINRYRNKSTNNATKNGLIHSKQNHYDMCQQLSLDQNMRQEIKRVIVQRKQIMEKVKGRIKQNQIQRAKAKSIMQLADQRTRQMTKKSKPLQQLKNNAILNRQQHNLSQKAQNQNMKNKKALIAQYESNCFDKINKSLQQICQKWKNKANSLTPHIQPIKNDNIQKNPINIKQKSQLVEQKQNNDKSEQKQDRIKIKKIPKLSLNDHRQQSIIPLSVETNRQRSIKRDEQIDRKIKQMMNKLRIQK